MIVGERRERESLHFGTTLELDRGMRLEFRWTVDLGDDLRLAGVTS